LWSHVYLAETRDAAGELDKCLNAFEDTHVSETDFLRILRPVHKTFADARTLINSNLACSLRLSMVLVTLNMVLMIS